MDTLDEAAVSAYYAAVAPALGEYLDLGTVRAAGWTGGTDRLPGEQGLRDPQCAVHETVATGSRWLSWVGGGSAGGPAGSSDGAGVPGCVRVSAGAGSDVAVAATAVLALLEAVQGIATAAVPASESAGTLLLYVLPRTALQPAVTTLVAQAPEIATEDVEAADGRALLTEVVDGGPVPLPYSLVDGADGTTAVVPLSVDEVAAVTAGMPLDPQPADVLDRLAVFGDLARALLPLDRP